MPPKVETEEQEQPSGLDRWLLPFVHESTLWPVLIVVIAHAAAFLSPVMLLALRDRRLNALAALLAAAMLTVWAGLFERSARGRSGALAGVLLSIWLLSAGMAWAAHHYGVF